MSRITILELFPLYYSARKWGNSSQKEIVRLEKEFTIVKTTSRTIEYKIDNLLSRKDEPAEIWYYKNGQIKLESWYLNGKFHRLPHCIQCGNYNSCPCGQKFRKDGPATIWYDENGQIKYEFWYLNGKLHRKDGPAHIEYFKDGQVLYESWYLNGERYRKRFT